MELKKPVSNHVESETPTYLEALDLVKPPPTLAVVKSPLQKMIDMGFSETNAVVALRMNKGNLEEAICVCLARDSSTSSYIPPAKLVKSIKEEGFSEKWANIALKKCRGDVEGAIQFLKDHGGDDAKMVKSNTRPTAKNSVRSNNYKTLDPGFKVTPQVSHSVVNTSGESTINSKPPSVDSAYRLPLDEGDVKTTPQKVDAPSKNIEKLSDMSPNMKLEKHQEYLPNNEGLSSGIKFPSRVVGGSIPRSIPLDSPVVPSAGSTHMHAAGSSSSYMHPSNISIQNSISESTLLKENNSVEDAHGREREDEGKEAAKMTTHVQVVSEMKKAPIYIDLDDEDVCTSDRLAATINFKKSNSGRKMVSGGGGIIVGTSSRDDPVPVSPPRGGAPPIPGTISPSAKMETTIGLSTELLRKDSESKEDFQTAVSAESVSCTPVSVPVHVSVVMSVETQGGERETNIVVALPATSTNGNDIYCHVQAEDVPQVIAINSDVITASKEVLEPNSDGAAESVTATQEGVGEDDAVVTNATKKKKRIRNSQKKSINGKTVATTPPDNKLSQEDVSITTKTTDEKESTQQTMIVDTQASVVVSLVKVEESNNHVETADALANSVVVTPVLQVSIPMEDTNTNEIQHSTNTELDSIAASDAVLLENNSSSQIQSSTSTSSWVTSNPQDVIQEVRLSQVTDMNPSPPEVPPPKVPPLQTLSMDERLLLWEIEQHRIANPRLAEIIEHNASTVIDPLTISSLLHSLNAEDSAEEYAEQQEGDLIDTTSVANTMDENQTFYEASAPPLEVESDEIELQSVIPVVLVPTEAPPSYDSVVTVPPPSVISSVIPNVSTAVTQEIGTSSVGVSTFVNEHVVIPTARAVDGNTNQDDYYLAAALIPVATESRLDQTNIRNLGMYTTGDSGRLYMAVAAPLVPTDQSALEASRNAAVPSPIVNSHFNKIKRRVILPFQVEERNGKFYPKITLVQPKIKSASKSPQGSRPDFISLGSCSSREIAMKLGAVNSPPTWAGGNDLKECSLCLKHETFFSKIHHCRNCGYYVCTDCSDKTWMHTMLPPAYVSDNEMNIRVCDSCTYLMEGFDDALRNGDAVIAMAFFSTGNVNLHNQLSIYKSSHYPIHSAAQGGNIEILRWLLEVRRCTVRREDMPLETSEGLSVFAIAAYYGHTDIMRYLVQIHGCKVTEVKDYGVMLRALHASLEVCYDSTKLIIHVAS